MRNKAAKHSSDALFFLQQNHSIHCDAMCYCQGRVTLKLMGLKYNLIPLTQWWASTLWSISLSDKSLDMSKRQDRSWTLFLHIWARHCLWLKVQVTQTVSVLPLWVCLCSSSVSQLLLCSYRALQDDPLRPSCSPPAGPVHPHCCLPGGWRPSCTTTTTTTRTGFWWHAGRGREWGMGIKFP